MGTQDDSLTRTLRALSDPTRRTILALLRGGGSPVSELAKRFAMSRPAISKHLGLLREAGLVEPRRQGRQQIYELTTAPLAEVRGWLDLQREDPSPARASRQRTTRAVAGGWRCW